MAVRAKFRCHSIKLTQATAYKSGVEYKPDSEHRNEPYVDAEGNRLTNAEAVFSWEQPTVELYAVTTGSEENKEFFAATPSARCEMTISNPDAAEFFELGGEYYLDFSRAT